MENPNYKWFGAFSLSPNEPLAQSLDEPTLALYVVGLQKAGLYPMTTICRISQEMPNVLVL